MDQSSAQPLSGRPFLKAGFPGLLLLLLLFLSAPRVSGQTSPENPWTKFANISASGTATRPYIVAGSDGQVHILWLDQLSGFVHVAGDGESWSEPETFFPPFFTATGSGNTSGDGGFVRLKFAVDQSGFIYAFWTDKDDNLFFSSASLVNIAQPGGWEASRSLAVKTQDMDIVIDRSGILHLGYISLGPTDELPAGVYYRQSRDGGAAWSTSRLLYTSSYFRLVDQSNAHVDVGAGGISQVFVAWDDPRAEQVYVAVSDNRGQSWNPSTLIDRRLADDDLNSIGPFGIQAEVSEDGVAFVTWQSAHGTNACSQYFSLYQFDEKSWTALRPMSSGLDTCPANLRFFHSAEQTIAAFEVQDVINLSLLDDLAFSAPQPQASLVSLIDEETVRAVIFDCGRTVGRGADHLVMAGCGGNTVKDIWVSTRPLASIQVNFDLEAPWSLPLPLSGVGGLATEPILLGGQEDRVHAFWSVLREPGAASELVSGGQAIYYTQWTGRSWATPVEVLWTETANAAQLDVIQDGQDRFLAVWSDLSTGAVYFSQTAIAQAFTQTAWAVPRQISGDHRAGWPAVVSEPGGRVFVVFAAPINDRRGLYLVYSDDSGINWSSPELIVDGAAFGWPVISAPDLVIDGAGNPHILFEVRSSPETQSGKIYYTRRTAPAGSWTPPEIVSDQSREDKLVIWHDLEPHDGQSLIRLWHQWRKGATELFYQVSTENGQAWGEPVRLSTTTEPIGPARIVVDGSGNRFLFQLMQDPLTTGQAMLGRWVWSGGRWVHLSDQKFTGISPFNGGKMSAALTETGAAMAVFLANPAVEAGIPAAAYYTIGRQPANLSVQPSAPPETSGTITAPVLQATVTPIPPATLPPASGATAAPPATVTPAPTSVVVVDQTPPEEGSDPLTSGVIMAAVSAGLLIAAVVGWRVYSRRR